MQSLTNYESLFEAHILGRAEGYANDEDIEIIHRDKHKIEAYVFGTTRYRVEILLNNAAITRMHCSCPYDYGDYCKHLAAVLIFLENEQEMSESEEMVVSQKKTPQKQSISHILTKATKQEIVKFLNILIREDPILADRARLHFEKRKPGGNKDYKKYVKKFFDKHCDKEWGFLDWHSTSIITDHFDNMFHTLQKAGKHSECIELSAPLINKTNDSMLHTEDSNGELSGLLYSIFEALHEIASLSDFKESHRVQMFNTLIAILDNSHIYDWDCGTLCWNLLADIVKTEDEFNRFTAKMKASLYKQDDWSYGYLKKEIAVCTLTAMKRLNTKKEVNEFLLQNKELPDIRTQLVDREFKKGNYAASQQLIQEGIELAKAKKHPGIVSRWEDKLLALSIKQNDEKAIVLWAKHNLLNHHFDIKNFHILKKHTAPARWEAERTSIIHTLTADNHYRQGVMKIYAEEEMYEELFQAIAGRGDDFYLLDEYAESLKKIDKNRLTDMYVERIKIFLERNTGRKYYKVAAQYIRKLKKWGTEKKASILAEEMKKKYFNRPALQQEFQDL